MAVYSFVTPAGERDTRKWALIVYILQACLLLVGIVYLQDGKTMYQHRLWPEGEGVAF